ncbi:MAG: hypothetical protein GEV07_16400 [Streptosporangiales bacterium]|nr:hypothetical protein [Streptosporangiales bacterium]
MSRTVRCRILGPLAAEVAGAEVDLGGPRPRSLLAGLLLDVDRVVDPESLIAAIWGDRPPASARALLSVHVSALRKAFVAAGCADEVIETVGSGYRVRSDTVALDAHLAAQRIETARSAAGAGRHGDAEETFRAALDLWHGPVLDGLCSPPIRAGAQRLAELRLAAAEEWAELALLLGHLDAVADALPAVLAEQPLRERARAQLMLALARLGRKADALEVYEQGHQLLVEEQGLEPGAVLTDLRNAIDDDALPTQLAGAAAAVDSYRLVELPPAVPHFTGRQTDLAVLDSLLDHSTTRPGTWP